MAIKTPEQQKQRMMDGKPIGEFFNATAQRQKRDNQYATYDGSAAKRVGSAAIKRAASAMPKAEVNGSKAQEKSEVVADKEPKGHAVSYKTPQSQDKPAATASGDSWFSRAAKAGSSAMTKAFNSARDKAMKEKKAASYATPARKIKLKLPDESTELDAMGEPKVTPRSVHTNRYGT